MVPATYQSPLKLIKQKWKYVKKVQWPSERTDWFDGFDLKPVNPKGNQP